jgi:glutamine synthetase
MSATNEHRLGAGEAPPAIISTFLGSQISSVLDRIESSKSDEDIRFDSKNLFRMSGLTQIPTLLRDNTDRNRTSPFAFTGNRFEFRAVGASDNCAEAIIVINTAVAEQLTEFKRTIDRKLERGEKRERAIYETIREIIKQCKPIRFDGNGYSDEWKAEAARRGLDCEVSAPLNFDRFLDPQTVAMFSTMGVYNEVELEARAEIKREMYVKKIQIEARVLGDIAMNHIVPIASKYEGVLLEKAWKLQQLGMNWATDKSLIENIQTRISKIQTLVSEMIECRKRANRIEDMRQKAIAYHDTVAVFFDTIREEIDCLEEVVDDQIWTLPKYREILFIK